MKSVKKVLSILLSPFGRKVFIFSFIGILLAIFLFTQSAIWFDVLSGNFPLPLLVKVIPAILYDFWFGSPSLLVHYLIVTTLFSTYITLLIFLFVKERFFSPTSFGASFLSLFGVSVGLVCLSCGALAGAIVFSVLGATTATALLTLNSSVYFLLAEALLLVSIAYMVLIMPKR